MVRSDARGVAEFGDHPRAEDRSYPGLGHDDLGIRVPAKRCFDLTLQDSDLLGESDQHRDRGAGGGRVRGGDHTLAPQLLATQHGRDPDGLGVDVAAAVPV